MRLDAIERGFAAQIIDDAVAHAQCLGYSKEMIKWGFSRMLAQWSTSEWIAFLQNELPVLEPIDIDRLFETELCDDDRSQIWTRFLGPKTRFYRRVALIPASTVPSAVFQDICQILVLPVTLTVRPPQAHFELYKAWKQRFDQSIPSYGARLTIATPSHDDDETFDLCRSHDCICISGSDDTVDHYRSLCAAIEQRNRPRIVAHGHRLSAICIDKEAFQSLDRFDYLRMAIDASVWDQTGCLSPKFAFIEANFDAACRLAENLCAALDKIGIQLPAIPPDIAASAAKNSALLMASLDGAFVVRSMHGDAVAVYPKEAPFEPLLHPRLLQIYCADSAIDAALALRPRGQAMATLTTLPFEAKKKLEQAGFNYFCTLGHMQNPPMTWLHDGIGTLRPLIQMNRAP